MINHIQLDRFGPLGHIDWPALGPINLIIGGNGSGKTFLLKAIYCTLRTLEGYKRGNEQRSAAEILADKLYWTFQADKIGDLVSKGADGLLHCEIKFDMGSFSYGFGKDASKQISNSNLFTSNRSGNSIFIPAKEILSLYQIILKSREQDKIFGFDDTCVDLVKALRYGGPSWGFLDQIDTVVLKDLKKLIQDHTRYSKAGGMTPSDLGDLSNYSGKEFSDLVELINSMNKKELNHRGGRFSDACEEIEKIIGGVVEFSNDEGRWLFAKGRQKYPIGVTAEGVRKIAVIDTLLKNGYLDTRSVVLIDEPESALHPTAISQLLDIVAMLAERGIQFFMASHSYFVVKKLFLIAQERGWSVPVLSSAEDGSWHAADLKDGMPDNPIIEESVRLYRQEVELALK